VISRGVIYGEPMQLAPFTALTHLNSHGLLFMRLRSAAQLGNKISLTQVGERLQLTLRRKGAVRDVSVEVAPAAETTGKVYSRQQ
jgi:hypothetical protein